MKTLLINPPQSWRGLYISREEYGTGLVDKRFLPSNVFLAASYLRQQGNDVDFVDTDTPNLALDGYDVVVVWVSVINSFYDDMVFLKRAKEEGKKTIMILNDAYEGLEMEAMQSFSFIDAAVRLWEREVVLDTLLSKWKQNKNPDCAGVIYRMNGSIVDTGVMPHLPSLDHLPSYANLLKEISKSKYKAAAITTGRGCPMGHTYCLYRRTGLRKRRIEHVAEEMDAVSDIGKVFIIDTAMPSAVGWTDRFCDQLIRGGRKVSWRADVRLEDCSPERLKKFKKAGCDAVMIGVETLDEELKRKLNGGTTAHRLKVGIREIRNAGIAPILVFHIGFPWDSDETLSKIRIFLKETGVASFILKQVRPWIGTPLYQHCKELGLLDKDLTIDDYVHSDYPLIDTLYLSKKEIDDWKYAIRRDAILNWRYMRNAVLEKRPVTLRQLKLLLELTTGRKGGWDN
jgi:hypothetical protein